MRLRQRLEQLAAGVGEAYLLPPLVRRIGGAAHEAGGVGAVDQLHHAVVAEQERAAMSPTAGGRAPSGRGSRGATGARGRGASACGRLRKVQEDSATRAGTAPAVGFIGIGEICRGRHVPREYRFTNYRGVSSLVTPPRRLLLLTAIARGARPRRRRRRVGAGPPHRPRSPTSPCSTSGAGSAPSFTELDRRPASSSPAIAGALVDQPAGAVGAGHPRPRHPRGDGGGAHQAEPHRAAHGLAKPLSAAIAIGTGGPFGAEGPIIVTGGALGSLLGQVLRVSPSERKILLAAGAAAGMAATFGAPLAAVVLAIELLLFEFSTRAFVPLVVAASVAGGMHSLLFGAGPLFTVPPHDYAGLAVAPVFVAARPRLRAARHRHHPRACSSSRPGSAGCRSASSGTRSSAPSVFATVGLVRAARARRRLRRDRRRARRPPRARRRSPCSPSRSCWPGGSRSGRARRAARSRRSC